MGINKVVYGNQTLVDLTEDSVSSENLLEGETAHDRSGARIVGTLSDFTGATSQAAGTHGLVPAPAAGEESKFLKGDGTWAVPSADDVSFDDTETDIGATDVQTAIEVLASRLNITYNTYSRLIVIPSNVGVYNAQTKMIILN